MQVGQRGREGGRDEGDCAKALHSIEAPPDTPAEKDK
jgi:hypothetical protein